MSELFLNMALEDEYELFDYRGTTYLTSSSFDPTQACEDDWEYKTPYVDILPEESETEEGSPLSF